MIFTFTCVCFGSEGFVSPDSARRTASETTLSSSDLPPICLLSCCAACLYAAAFARSAARASAGSAGFAEAAASSSPARTRTSPRPRPRAEPRKAEPFRLPAGADARSMDEARARGETRVGDAPNAARADAMCASAMA